MNNDIKEFFNNTLSKLFPEDITCFLCGGEINESSLFLCDKCEKQLLKKYKRCPKCDALILDENKFCKNCVNHARSFDLAKAKFFYQDKLATVIKKFKYENKKFYAKHLARIMTLSYLEFKNTKFDYIIPVPLHEEKLKQRGYNQAKLLADELSKIIDIPVKDDLVIRTINTPSQTELNIEKRHENMKNAFKALDKKFCKNKNFLIVDDILTTGATTDSVSLVLKNCGANNVCVIAAARAVLN